MITEHNYPQIYVLQIPSPATVQFVARKDFDLYPTTDEEEALTFLDSRDAERFIRNWLPSRRDIEVVEIKFPFRLEYEIVQRLNYWQIMRTYRTKDDALAGFQNYTRQVKLMTTTLREYIWRVIDARTNQVIISAVPNQLSFVEEEQNERS